MMQDLSQTPDQSQKCFITPPPPPPLPPLPHSFSSPTADIVFYRSYSRRDDLNRYESWDDVVNRIIDGLKDLGELTFEETKLLWKYFYSIKALPSGRWMWVGGTDWIKKPENYHGAFNCTSTNIADIESLALMMDLAMQGSGTGAVLEERYISQLPMIRNEIELVEVTEIGTNWREGTYPDTGLGLHQSDVDMVLVVGDSRRGWVSAYLEILRVATANQIYNPRKVSYPRIRVDLSYVRPAGVKLKGFGGVSNPIKLPELFPKMVKILNGAVGRQLTAQEICLLIDEAALVVVAGNVRRSAGMRQFDSNHPQLKLDLWKEVDGNWMIDPERDALRMANHTRVYHHKPTEQECIDAVRLQYQCGEGAIQFAPEAIARANADIFNTPGRKKCFLDLYQESSTEAIRFIEDCQEDEYGHKEPIEIRHRLARYGLNPCFAGHMRLFTSEGYRKFEDLDGTEPEIINASGRKVKSKVWCSGKKEVITLTLSDGKTLTCTPDHVLMTTNGRREAQNCKGFSLQSYCNPSMTRDKELLDAGVWGNPTVVSIEFAGIMDVYDFTEPLTNWGVVEGFVVHNCGEIIGSNFHCNLSEVHLNQLNPFNFQDQEEAFKVAALSVAVLLKRGFVEERYQKSRELDPIVGVSFTGLFDFFVHAFGVDWLRWWEAGRPEEWNNDQSKVWDLIRKLPLQVVDPVIFGYACVDWDLAEIYRSVEQHYLEGWKKIAHEAVWEYCDRHNLKRPNRCTTVQPAGSKSLLTGASPGWHPPKAARYIRRITCRKNDPVALAGLDYGYSVVPSQSDKDDEGNLLNDPFDPRCTEWLLEIPAEVSWANLPGADQIQIEKFSALAQIDFYMQVQKYYVTHNSSATWEIRESEIEEVGKKIYQLIQDDEGYISATVLARFDDSQTFPRLPFEPISKEVYDQLKKEVQERRTSDNYLERLNYYSQLEGQTLDPVGPAGCDSDKCLLSDMKPKS